MRPGSRQTIVVVERTPAVQELVDQALQETGHRIFVTKDPLEALELAYRIRALNNSRAGQACLDNEGRQMATWIWIVIAIAAVIVLAALVLGARRAKDRRVVQQREQAQELRQEAEQRHRSAKERENLSKELADRAKAEREQGDKAAAQAARVDPDRD